LKNNWLIALNMILLVVFTELICAFQTSLWMQVLGGFPPPLMWVVLMTYVVLHRHVWEGVMMTYILTFVIGSFTAEPFEHLLLANLVCLIFILLVKNRIYWTSTNYFMMMSGATTILHFVLVVVMSQFLDHNPLRSPEFFQWMISFLLTLLVSLPMYWFLRRLDSITQRDETAESTGGLI
jgi:hypothetical protein